MALQVLENTIPFDAIAGGETAGIPFAAWIAELMSLPMIYAVSYTHLTLPTSDLV